MGSQYHELFDDVIGNGSLVSSRYGDTQELLGVSVELDAGIMVKRKGINWSLGFMELLQLVAGVWDRDAVARVAPNADLSLFTPEMAYGPRVADQIPIILEKLTNDPLTRQAVLFIGKPWDGPTNNQPCTTSMQFLVRDNTLVTFVTMRSWDLVKGFPYDIMMFGGLAMIIAHLLNYDIGTVTVTATSLHVYYSDMKKTPLDATLRFDFDEDFMFATWEDFQDWARVQIAEAPWPDGVPTGIEVTDGDCASCAEDECETH